MKATKVTIHTLRQMKARGEKIAMLTAYDATFARLLANARVLGDAGVYSIVLEAIPADVAHEITAAVTVPTIGIGAGTGCDGQVLVSYDALGMDETFKPRFVRRYATLGATIKDAVGRYVADVRGGSFPSDAESFTVAESKAAPGSIEPAPYSSAAKKP